MVGTHAETQDFTQHVIDQLIQPSTITALVTRLVKQHVKTAVARQAKLRDHDAMQEADKDQNTLYDRLLVTQRTHQGHLKMKKER